MKTASSLAFSFLFLAFITKPLLVASEQPLVDINGDKVRTGTTYRIVSAFREDGGGGLTLAIGRNGRFCPFDVSELGSDLSPGAPFLFSPVNNTVEEENYVYESTDLNIIFAIPQIMICGQPIVWKVDNYDQSTGQWFITTNGTVGNPGAQTLQSWFKFEKVDGNTYKIKYCPSVCETCASLCSDIGIDVVNSGVRYVVLSKTSPYLVRLYKAEDASNGKIVSVI